MSLKLWPQLLILFQNHSLLCISKKYNYNWTVSVTFQPCVFAISTTYLLSCFFSLCSNAHWQTQPTLISPCPTPMRCRVCWSGLTTNHTDLSVWFLPRNNRLMVWSRLVWFLQFTPTGQTYTPTLTLMTGSWMSVGIHHLTCTAVCFRPLYTEGNMSTESCVSSALSSQQATQYVSLKVSQAAAVLLNSKQ